MTFTRGIVTRSSVPKRKETNWRKITHKELVIPSSLSPLRSFVPDVVSTLWPFKSQNINGDTTSRQNIDRYRGSVVLRCLVIGDRQILRVRWANLNGDGTRKKRKRGVRLRCDSKARYRKQARSFKGDTRKGRGIFYLDRAYLFVDASRCSVILSNLAAGFNCTYSFVLD